VSNPFPVSSVSLVSVRGITVSSQIASALDSMLAAAAAEGHSFGGGGYRSPEAQWALRQAHCPDPVNSPPSACSPPTARPGSSMHELGLAVDFTYQGALISSRNNAGFQWLAANAGAYGFRNLPSEPWHWSINGN
jgi:D-alanyl-D-alanine carboxypeptidase